LRNKKYPPSLYVLPEVRILTHWPPDAWTRARLEVLLTWSTLYDRGENVEMPVSCIIDGIGGRAAAAVVGRACFFRGISIGQLAAASVPLHLCLASVLPFLPDPHARLNFRFKK